MKKAPVLEVAPLDTKKMSMFENPGNLETVEECKKKADDRGQTNKKSSSRKATSPTSPPSSSARGRGKEQQPSKSKGSRKKQDS